MNHYQFAKLFSKIRKLLEWDFVCHIDMIFLYSFNLSEDADQLRMHTLSESGDVESLEKMVDDGSDSEESIEDPSEDP